METKTERISKRQKDRETESLKTNGQTDKLVKARGQKETVADRQIHTQSVGKEETVFQLVPWWIILATTDWQVWKEKEKREGGREGGREVLNHKMVCDLSLLHFFKSGKGKVLQKDGCFSHLQTNWSKLKIIQRLLLRN